MFNLSSHTVRGNLILALMIRSKFPWLRAKPSLLCQAWNIYNPAVAWRGSGKSFSLLTLPVKQSHLLFLLLTQLESQSFNSQSVIHMEEFYWRVQLTTFSVSCPSPWSFVSFFSQIRHSLLPAEQLPSAFQSSFLKSALNQLRNEI